LKSLGIFKLAAGVPVALNFGWAKTVAAQKDNAAQSNEL
jgi:hypothetical protein